jgi:Xaa-Pro aminopeptidase
VDLLDEAELNWINDYHAKVFSNLGPLLEDEVRDWLRQATLPLPGTSLPRSG